MRWFYPGTLMRESCQTKYPKNGGDSVHGSVTHRIETRLELENNVTAKARVTTGAKMLRVGFVQKRI
jgi:hypothetical protein